MPGDEKRTQNDIIRTLGTRPDLRIWRQNTGSAEYRDERTGRARRVAFGVPGAADITGILPDGRRLEIEVKSPTGRQSKAQKQYQAIIERFGGVYILARGAEEAIAALDAKGYPAPRTPDDRNDCKPSL